MKTTKAQVKKSNPESVAIETTAPAKVAAKKTFKKQTDVQTAEVAVAEAVVSTGEGKSKKPLKTKKAAKVKVIRDSFSFPEEDYQIISALKKTCLTDGVHVKKGEILRAGLHLLTKLDIEGLKQAVEQVEKVKTGRPSASET